MPRRPSCRRLLTGLAVTLLAAACADDPDGIAATGDERADQARAAALDAGLATEVADFLGLLARGSTATYRVRFPGPEEGTELSIVSRPPDRRVEVRRGDALAEVRLLTGGMAYTCTPGEDGALVCERTDALVDPPGVFRAEALDELTASLADRATDYTFEIETLPVAGIEASCLVTRLRSGREDADLGASGTICASGEGAVVLVDQGDERLEALAYSSEVDGEAFERPDVRDDDGGS